jgi:hypothetical protein
MEIMNESTILVMTCGLVYFSNFVPEPEMRSDIGLIFMKGFSVNIMINLSYLTLNAFTTAKQEYKSRAARKLAKSERYDVHSVEKNTV